MTDQAARLRRLMQERAARDAAGDDAGAKERAARDAREAHVATLDPPDSPLPADTVVPSVAPPPPEAEPLRSRERALDGPGVEVRAAAPPAAAPASPTAAPPRADVVAPSPSTPSGAVSFRPRPVRGDHVRRPPRHVERTPRLARAVAVCSGKGGVGKSNVALNLAVAMARRGRHVVLLDADLGMANVDVLCNLSPRTTLQHVVAGRCSLAEAMLLAPGGFHLIPGASGVAGLADLGRGERARILDELVRLEREADVFVIDCGAGISANVLAFAAAADTTLVVTTPEPTAITDAYGTVKNLVRRAPRSRPRLVVNMTTHPDEAAIVHGRMDRVVRTFLQRPLELAGTVPWDAAVGRAVQQRVPFALLDPTSPATRAVERLGDDLLGLPDADAGREGFLARLVRRLRPAAHG